LIVPIEELLRPEVYIYYRYSLRDVTTKQQLPPSAKLRSLLACEVE
jgi:hypothetical protein